MAPGPAVLFLPSWDYRGAVWLGIGVSWMHIIVHRAFQLPNRLPALIILYFKEKEMHYMDKVTARKRLWGLKTEIKELP